MKGTMGQVGRGEHRGEDRITSVRSTLSARSISSGHAAGFLLYRPWMHSPEKITGNAHVGSGLGARRQWIPFHKTGESYRCG